MIVIPVNPNSVYVPMIQTGCVKAEFDSTYPIHLNGIISQNEFRESINRINRTISSTKILGILGILFVLTPIVGIILCIVGGITAVNSIDRFGFPVLIGVGIGIFAFGPIIFMIGFCTIQFKLVAKMRQAIAEESMKYSSRSSTPCSWRLDTTTNYVGTYGNQHNSQLVYHLVIDIGRSVAPGSGVYYSNQVAAETTSVFGRQNNYSPPPYHGQSAAIGFCSRCNAPRQDFTAKFCPSCGNSFSIY